MSIFFFEMTPTLVQQISTFDATNCSEQCLEAYEINMCLRKGKPCKSNISFNVSEGFANWMWDHGNEQNYFKTYIKLLAKLMTTLCKIDARKNNAKNMASREMTHK